MKIRRIADYFPSSAATSQTQPVAEQEVAPEAQAVTGEAVRISRSARAGDEAGASTGGRSEKVARLAEAVRSGSYRPDSKVVAEAVYKELF